MAERIIVYGTTWCGTTTRCRQVLADRLVDYVWIDITDNPEACAFVEKVNRGFRSVPTILFPDGTLLVEPTTGQLNEKLDSLR